MPATTARIGRERRLRTLAKNLFEIEGPDSAEKLRRAEHALLRDNPRLAERDAFRSGTVVAVPADLDLRPTARVEQPAADLEGLLAAATQGLEMTERQTQDGVARHRQTVEAALARLQDETFRSAVEKTAPQAQDLIPAAQQALQGELKETEQRATETGKAIKAATEEIARLRKRTGQTLR